MGVAATLSVSAEAAISFTAATGNSWIVLSPASGTTPASLTVRPNPTGLEPGPYSSTITLTFADGRTFSVPVTLSVAAGLSITALVNAASYAAGPGAPNTVMAAFGSFPGCTSGAQVSIDDAPTAVFASSTTQINFLVPATVAGKQTAGVQITCGGIISQSVPLQIAGESPAIFTANQSGTGQAAIVNEDGSLTAPSPAGTIVSVYGTGFGLLGSPGADGLAHTLDSVTAFFGSEATTAVYAGEAPGYTYGLQQINIRIPTDVPVGALIPLLLTVGGSSSQAGVTLAIQ
jgi:uncharacterized protein (TIGR03437 family)